MQGHSQSRRLQSGTSETLAPSQGTFWNTFKDMGTRTFSGVHYKGTVKYYLLSNVKSQSLISGTSRPQMASQCSKVKVARAQQTRATLPASATPFGMTTTSLPLTVRLSTHLCLPSPQHARAQRSSAHS